MKLSTATPLLLLLAPRVESASETQPHYHRGVLKPYTLGPPDILLSAGDERQLRTGKAVTQALASEDETRRLVMVQDINAPHQIVMSRIMDFEKYDQMVSGVDACTNYCSYEEAAKKTLMGVVEQPVTQTVKSTYQSARPPASRPPAARESPASLSARRSASRCQLLALEGASHGTAVDAAPPFERGSPGSALLSAHRSPRASLEVQVLREAHLRSRAALHGLLPRLRPAVGPRRLGGLLVRAARGDAQHVPRLLLVRVQAARLGAGAGAQPTAEGGAQEGDDVGER